MKTEFIIEENMNKTFINDWKMKHVYWTWQMIRTEVKTEDDDFHLHSNEVSLKLLMLWLFLFGLIMKNLSSFQSIYKTSDNHLNRRESDYFIDKLRRTSSDVFGKNRFTKEKKLRIELNENYWKMLSSSVGLNVKKLKLLRNIMINWTVNINLFNFNWKKSTWEVFILLLRKNGIHCFTNSVRVHDSILTVTNPKERRSFGLFSFWIHHGLSEEWWMIQFVEKSLTETRQGCWMI